MLVIGASGAVGTAAVQLANLAGAKVTAVCSGGNANLVQSLGARRVIDYTKVDFTQLAETYDIIVDCVGNVPFSRPQPLIKPGGALLSVIADLVGILAAGSRSRRTRRHITAGNVPFTAADLTHIAHLAGAGLFHPVIDRTFDLSNIADAHWYVDTDRKRATSLSGWRLRPNPSYAPKAAGTSRTATTVHKDPSIRPDSMSPSLESHPHDVP